MQPNQPIQGILALLGMLLHTLKEASTETVQWLVSLVQDTMADIVSAQGEIANADRRIAEHRQAMEASRNEIHYWKQRKHAAIGDLEELQKEIAEKICQHCVCHTSNSHGPGVGALTSCSGDYWDINSPCKNFERQPTEEDAASGLSALFG